MARRIRQGPQNDQRPPPPVVPQPCCQLLLTLAHQLFFTLGILYGANTLGFYSCIPLPLPPPLPQSCYQLFFTLGILYGANTIGFYSCIPAAPKGSDFLYSDIPYGRANCTRLSNDGYGNQKDFNYRDTIIYNSFVWSQVPLPYTPNPKP